MSLEVEVTGLKDFIPSIGDGNLILVTGGAQDYIKSKFLQDLAYSSSFSGSKDVTYLTTLGERRVIEDLNEKYGDIDDIDMKKPSDHRSLIDNIFDTSLLVVDSFSYIMIGKDYDEFKAVLEGLHEKTLQDDAITFLVFDEGMLEDKFMSTSYHLCEGIIEFKLRDTSEGIVRYINIPKWTDGSSFDDNIYYEFVENNIKIDSRRRVV